MAFRRRYRKRPTYNRRRRFVKRNRWVRGRVRDASGYRTTVGTTIFKPIGSYKFTYAHDLDITAAAGSSALQLFRGNSLFDPDATGVGGQPRYFDTLCGASGGTAPYNQYVVNAFFIRCYFRNMSNDHMFVSISAYPTSSSSAPATIEEARERPDTIIRVIAPKGSGPATTMISMYGKNNKILGYKDLKDNDSTKALYNANPADSVSVAVIAWNPDGTGSNTVGLNAVIRYYTNLMRLTDVADS